MILSCVCVWERLRWSTGKWTTEKLSIEGWVLSDVRKREGFVELKMTINRQTFLLREFEFHLREHC
jgi:hypothetical protein